MASQRAGFAVGSSAWTAYEHNGPVLACAFSPYERSAALLAFSDNTHVITATFSRTREFALYKKLSVGARSSVLAFSPKSLVFNRDAQR